MNNQLYIAEIERRYAARSAAAPAVAADPMAQLETEARALARSNRGVETPCLYCDGTRRGTTPEQAFAAALESNPEAYEAYRNRHNANAILNSLAAAGVRINN